MEHFFEKSRLEKQGSKPGEKVREQYFFFTVKEEAESATLL